MDIKQIYNNLTNVDIEEQRRLWDERGKGYFGEYLVFCELYNLIQGNCKILMNLNVPFKNGKKTEVDLVMIHETGIYVFEVKHYKGTIYGNSDDKIWTQYFRTVKNNVFKNPILQNEYHISALKELFRNIPIKSIIVFTSSECDIRVNNSNNRSSICNLYNLKYTIDRNIMLEQPLYNMEQIDEIFEKLSQYSSMKETILYEGKEEPFINWLQPTINQLNLEKNNYLISKQSLDKTRKSCMIFSIIGIIACILFCILIISAIKTKYDNDLSTAQENYTNELNLFKQNFKHVDEIGNEYIDAVNDFIGVSNVSLNNLSNKVVSFSATLTTNNDVYGIALTEDSKYIVMTKSGAVFEYNVFGEHFPYSIWNNKIGKGIKEYGDLKPAQFYGVNKETINYIKITNIDLFKLDMHRTIIKQGLELELYSQ